MATAQTPSLNCIGATGAQSPGVSVYTAGNETAGTNLKMDVSAIATANSPEDLRVPANCTLVDFVCEVDGALAGVVEWYSNGMPTGVRIALAAHQATNSGRPPLRIPLGAAKIYRLKVVEDIVTTA